MCGGNGAPDQDVVADGGLSPLVRGKPSTLIVASTLVGSIPACAGETFYLYFSASAFWVYPRLCGGNGGLQTLSVIPTGLSPLVRGKLISGVHYATASGSIPACAGETADYEAERKTLGVYPRLCGGNTSTNFRILYILGLSPLVRGKLDPYAPYFGIVGSIPACAGETSSGPSFTSGFGVYPRLCGGN